MSRSRTLVTVAGGACLFLFSWLFRFNDPNGSFAGMTDDHFFYVVRGWQILFGDLPVRDFVDHGAPLYYYTAAAVQVIGGRGTLSELVFSVTVISLGAALTYWIAAKASGSLALGAAAAFLQILLEPRFYNYPKILVYAFAIPVLWSFIDRPEWRRNLLLAATTVVGFLYRHDHGVFVGVAMAAALVLMTHVPWRERLTQAVIYGAFVLVLVAPYLIFIQRHGGFESYISQASAWAARDRAREPVVFPGLFDEPVDPEQVVPGLPRVLDGMRANWVAWTFYAELALPFIALALLTLSLNGYRPDWPHARIKIAVIALLALVLNVGFLRSTLDARLADPSVPHAILLAWITVAAWRVRYQRGVTLRPSLQRHGALIAAIVIFVVATTDGIVALVNTSGLNDRLENAHVDEGLRTAFSRAAYMWGTLAKTWPLEGWTDPKTPGVMRLAFYLRDCTKPTDRVLIQSYLPQVPALAQRAFAGGHADLRPGFFRTTEAQELTVQRLRQQSVPVIALEPGDAFRESFPLIMAYLDEFYAPAGERALDERVTIHLLARKDLNPSGRYEPLDWPCFK